MARSRRSASRRPFEARGGGTAPPVPSHAGPGTAGVPVDPDGQERPALRPIGSRQPAPAVRPGLLGKGSGSPVGSIAASALLPLRLFAGFTFLYAGIDKLALDRSFLDLSSRTSILVQLQGYAHASPLAPLLTALAIPHAWLMGVLIALAEIAVGLGILSGLAFRAAAWGGAALSLLFFLTASWNVHPYYFGQDLPYGLAFVTLALAGHGNRYVLGPWLERQVFGAKPAGRQTPVPAPVSAERRYLLQAGVLGLSAIVLALVARPLRDLLLPASSANLSGTNASSGAVAAAPGSGASSTGAPGEHVQPAGHCLHGLRGPGGRRRVPGPHGDRECRTRRSRHRGVVGGR